MLNFYYLLLVINKIFITNDNNTTNNNNEINKTHKVFDLYLQNNIYNDLINILDEILTNYNLPQLTFLHKIIKKKTNNLLNELEINQQLSLFFSNPQQDENVEKEIDEVYKLLQDNTNINDILLKKNYSHKLLKDLLKMLIITKFIYLTQYQAEAYFSTNNFNSFNQNNIFASKKIYYIFFWEDSDKINKIFTTINTITTIDNVNNFIKNFHHHNYLILKNVNNYDFLKPGDMINYKVIINNKIYYKTIICGNPMEENINNLEFSLLTVHLKTNLDQDSLNNKLSILNKTQPNELIIQLNSLMKTNKWQLLSHEYLPNQPIERINNNIEFLDIILNFPYKKYLIIPQENHYILYLIIQTDYVKNKDAKIKNQEPIINYLIKNII